MYANGFQPLITKPTRVTSVTCTCIDNIFCNVLDKPIIPGILYSDVSDHFPIFQVTMSGGKPQDIQRDNKYLIAL